MENINIDFYMWINSCVKVLIISIHNVLYEYKDTDKDLNWWHQNKYENKDKTIKVLKAVNRWYYAKWFKIKTLIEIRKIYDDDT